MSDGTEFSWRQFWQDLRWNGLWFTWNDSPFLPGFAVAFHEFYDWHMYGLRVWRLAVFIGMRKQGERWLAFGENGR